MLTYTPTDLSAVFDTLQNLVESSVMILASNARSVYISSTAHFATAVRLELDTSSPLLSNGEFSTPVDTSAFVGAVTVPIPGPPGSSGLSGMVFELMASVDDLTISTLAADECPRDSFQFFRK